MTGEDRRQIIEYLFLVVAGLLLALGRADGATVSLLLAIYLNLERKRGGPPGNGGPG